MKPGNSSELDRCCAAAFADALTPFICCVKDAELIRKGEGSLIWQMSLLEESFTLVLLERWFTAPCWSDVITTLGTALTSDQCEWWPSDRPSTASCPSKPTAGAVFGQPSIHTSNPSSSIPSSTCIQSSEDLLQSIQAVIGIRNGNTSYKFIAGPNRDKQRQTTIHTHSHL